MKPLIDPINTSDGKFHPKNKQTGELATIVTPDFMNDDQDATRSMQQEIIAILSAADIKPAEATNNQLLTALKKILINADDDRVKNALQKDQNLNDLADKNKAISNLGLDKRYLPAFPVGAQDGGAHYTKIATIGMSASSAANTTLLLSGANNFGNNINQTDMVSLSFKGETPAIRHLILSDAGSAADRATWGYTLSADKKSADFWLIRPSFSGAFSLSMLSKAGGVTLHNDAPTTTSKPNGLVATPPVLAWSDKHKPAASDVDAVSASKGGTFKGNVTFAKTATANLVESDTALWAKSTVSYLPAGSGAHIGWNRMSGSGGTDFINHKGAGSGGFSFWNGNEKTQTKLADIDANGNLSLTGTTSAANEVNALRQNPGNVNDGDYLNGGLLRSFLKGRGANGDARGAYASLYIQEHVGSEHKAILNINGFGKDLNWTFESGGGFYSPGIIVEAGQRVYSPNNPPPLNIAGAITGIRLAGMVDVGKNSSDEYGVGCVMTGWYDTGSSHYHQIFRVLQYQINHGDWVTAPYA